MKQLVFFLALLVLLQQTLAKETYSVELKDGIYQLRHGEPQQFTLAWGHYEHEVMENGWGRLFVNTNPRLSNHQDSVKAYYAAGYLEGALTSEHIHNHYWSWWDYTFKSGSQPPAYETEQFMLEQDTFTRDLIKHHSGHFFYQALERVTAQFDGMLQGIYDHAKPEHNITKVDLLYLQGAGDMYEIIPATNPKARVNWESLIGEELKWQWEQSVSCSSLVKANDDWTEVVAGHTTWTSYQNMLRVYKYYNFHGPQPYRVSFSAKPGMVYSKDDFYVLPDNSLVVMETTNGVQNSQLYELVIPYTLLTWQRVSIANSIAKNGQEWTNLFIQHNSGTYNNQYIVVDMKTVKNGKPEKDFVWISETMPGMARTHDVTQVIISQGNYWPSYNIPYDKEIYAYGGYIQSFEKEGDFYSYEQCPRAQIFRRDHSKAQDVEGFKKVLRYNDFKNDPLSHLNPSFAIASRYDLQEKNPKAFGAIDAKLTSKHLVEQNQAWAQSGPSYDQQPTFSWGDWKGVRLGQPETFNFPWVLMTEQN